MTLNRTTDNLIHPEKSLSQRAVISGAWVFSLRVIQQLFSLARLMILARILAPQDFGLMGIALLSMATLETFSQTGFQQALIQKKHDIKPYLDTAWTFLILRGIILFAVLYLIAPYAATFFDAPEAKPIIQVIGLSVIFQAFTNIGVIHFQKELEFNKQFIYQLSGTLTDFVVAIAAVLILGNVWALVFGLLAGKAAMLLVSYLIHPYRPHLSFDIGKVKELSGFGKWVFGSSVLIFLLTQGDDILVGKLLGITALGFYQMAYLISNLPATEITHVISQVTFPVYSKIQDDIPKLREVYLIVLQLTAFVSFLLAALIFLLAPDFTILFLGGKWMPMVPALQVLCIFGVTRVINATTGPIFQAIHKPEISTFGSSFQLILFAIIVYPFTIKWGIIGISMSVIIPNILFMLYIGNKLTNFMDYNLRHFINVFVPLIVGIFTMASVIFIGKQRILTETSLTSLVIFIFVGVIIYSMVTFFADYIFNYGLIDNIKKVVGYYNEAQ